MSVMKSLDEKMYILQVTSEIIRRDETYLKNTTDKLTVNFNVLGALIKISD